LATLTAIATIASYMNCCRGFSQRGAGNAEFKPQKFDLWAVDSRAEIIM